MQVQMPFDASRSPEFSQSKWSLSANQRWPLDAFPLDASLPEVIPYGGPFKSCLPAPCPAAFKGEELQGQLQDQLSSDSRQITPVFIPGVQDHFTGLINTAKPPVLPKEAASLVSRSLAAPPGLGGSATDLGKQNLDAPCGAPAPVVSTEDETVNHEMKKLDDPGSHDVKKLESLIWLFLHTAKEGDNAPNSSEDASAPCEQANVVQEVPEVATSESEATKEEIAPPAAAFSRGSVGHPLTCAEACKYARKKRGCKDGLACSRCHLCTWYHKRNTPKSSEQEEIDAIAAIVVEPEPVTVVAVSA